MRALRMWVCMARGTDQRIVWCAGRVLVLVLVRGGWSLARRGCAMLNLAVRAGPRRESRIAQGFAPFLSPRAEAVCAPGICGLDMGIDVIAGPAVVDVRAGELTLARRARALEQGREAGSLMRRAMP